MLENSHTNTVAGIHQLIYRKLFPLNWPRAALASALATVINKNINKENLILNVRQCNENY